MSDNNNLELSQAERNSSLVDKLTEFLKGRLEFHRRRNDAENLDQVQTAALRGRIAELKNLLNQLAAGESQD